MMEYNSLLAVNDLYVSYGKEEILKNISFEIEQGKIIGLVGESGCGKSTLAQVLCRLIDYQHGSVKWLGQELRDFNKQQLQAYRKGVQLIFQSPQDALDPRMTIGQSVIQPLHYLTHLTLSEKAQLLTEVLVDVGLDSSFVDHYPHELSGGQCQRVNIARALVVKPQLLVCDEPVSSLDVSMQSQIINLLRELRLQYKVSILFISHDINSVRYLCDHLLVMLEGEIVEHLTVESMDNAKHAYTQQLISLSK